MAEATPKPRLDYTVLHALLKSQEREQQQQQREQQPQPQPPSSEDTRA